MDTGAPPPRRRYRGRKTAGDGGVSQAERAALTPGEQNFQDYVDKSTKAEEAAQGLMKKGKISDAIAKFQEVLQNIEEACEAAPGSRQDHKKHLEDCVPAVQANIAYLRSYQKYEYLMPK
eukprot:gnl/TRDRNA2_/TRDRNA2_188962_c0_seq1.p2 gnl/TRDRNA2_/TRDRNA2_188962_c0~~gnl/TRDRNA2_/TRDRNA2_188962_c0_seq1.p2  ORF type:complete len:120 (+),score=36.44 gnl/TRDRNA2_/TRDRNA2_188962_c0_seq1:65-424(+)